MTPFDDLGPIQIERLIRQYLDAGRVMEALVLTKKAIKAFDPTVRHRLLLSEIYEAKGERHRALELVEETDRLVPGDVRVARALERLRTTA